MAKTRYKQQIVFKKNKSTMGIYVVTQLVGRTEPAIETTYTAKEIQELIDRYPDVKVIIK